MKYTNSKYTKKKNHCLIVPELYYSKYSTNFSEWQIVKRGYVCFLSV